MSVVEDFKPHPFFGPKLDLSHSELVEAFNRAFALDDARGLSPEGMHHKMPAACLKTSLEGWQINQVAFAARIARISAAHATRRAEAIAKRHRRVSLVRRCALLFMVAAINMPIFL